MEIGIDQLETTDLPEVIDGLNDLLQLDHDALGAYEIAIEKLQNREHARRIEAFRQDHQRHVRDLNDLILSLGGRPTNEPHATAPLKQAIQEIAAGGGDEVILRAWRTNELQVTTKYDRYAHKAVRWPAAVKRVVDRNALDEEKHYQWVTTLLGDARPREVHAANRVREEITRAKAKGRQAAAGAGRLGDRIVDEIRQHPLRVMAATFAVGFVIGRLLRSAGGDHGE